MDSNEVIAAWKDPAVRASLCDRELVNLPLHPAGRSPFDCAPGNCSGGQLPATIRTIGMLTSIMSCNLACSETMWDGSCDFFSYGCCA
jgi:mersacidin/lichenicidin family type 2 lantibiotic